MRVQLAVAVKWVKRAAFNNALRRFDPDGGDCLDIPLWLTSENPTSDIETWGWMSWNEEKDVVDEMVDEIFSALGPVNDPGPQCQAAYWRSDEDDMDPDGILAATDRKPDQLRVV